MSRFRQIFGPETCIQWPRNGTKQAFFGSFRGPRKATEPSLFPLGGDSYEGMRLGLTAYAVITTAYAVVLTAYAVIATAYAVMFTATWFFNVIVMFPHRCENGSAAVEVSGRRIGWGIHA